jgi:outer membrane lipoprotein-sorting protein
MGGKVAWRLRGCNKFLAKSAFYRSYGRAPIKTDWKRMRAALFFVVALITLAASAAVQQDAASIIQRSVAANALDWQAAPDYDYFERDQQPDGGTKTYEDLMISGSPYQRLVAVNGKPLPLALEAEEQQKLEAMTRQRRSESEPDREERIAKYEKDRKNDQLLMDQLTKAMDFMLVGEQKLHGYDVYALKATPRAGYQPPNMESEVLTGMQGKLWIDKRTFQWVKVVAQVIHPVSIKGFLAEVEPGTSFELEKRPVEDGIWLPSHFAMKAKAKIFFLFPHRSQVDETYYGYRKVIATQADKL